MLAALERQLSWARDAAPPTLALLYQHRLVSEWYALPAFPSEVTLEVRAVQEAPCGRSEAPLRARASGDGRARLEEAPPAGAAPGGPDAPPGSLERRRAQLLERIRRRDPALAARVEAGEVKLHAAGRELGLVRRYIGKQARRDRERKQHRERALRRIAERDPELAKLARRGEVPLARACQQVGLTKHGTVREPQPEPEPEPEPEPVKPERRHPSKYTDVPEGVQSHRDEHETRSLRQQDAEFIASTIGFVKPELLERCSRDFRAEVGQLARKRGRYR